MKITSKNISKSLFGNPFRGIDPTSISYLIFGLGNPEPKARNQRHNIGKLFINDFALSTSLKFNQNK
jgi:hypothetical protein